MIPSFPKGGPDDQRPEREVLPQGESFEIRPKANLDGELLCSTPADAEEVMETLVGSGRYELLCLSPTGEHALSRFRVY